jgi:hypothetical protein
MYQVKCYNNSGGFMFSTLCNSEEEAKKLQTKYILDLEKVGGCVTVGEYYSLNEPTGRTVAIYA